MSRADDMGLSMHYLMRAYNEWLLTLDDETFDEDYGTERGTSRRYVRPFLDWLEAENG